MFWNGMLSRKILKFNVQTVNVDRSLAVCKEFKDAEISVQLTKKIFQTKKYKFFECDLVALSFNEATKFTSVLCTRK